MDDQAPKKDDQAPKKDDQAPKKRAFKDRYTAEEWEAIKARTNAVDRFKRDLPAQQRRCECCGWRAPAPLLARNPRLFLLAAHHIHAASLGGGHDGDNLILLCPTCHEIADYLSGNRVLMYQITTRAELLDELTLLNADPDAWDARQKERERQAAAKCVMILGNRNDG